MTTKDTPQGSKAVTGRSRAVVDDAVDIPVDSTVEDRGATTASPDGDESEEDARVAAISLALQDNSALWVQTVDDEVQLDTDIAAVIMLAALGEGYCNAACHDEEYNAIVEFIREYEPATACRDEIVSAIEEESLG